MIYSLLGPSSTSRAVAGDGEKALAQALAQALALRPDVLFLDIRMPGLDGLEVAQALADDWPDDAAASFPLLVFVTAYDQYALEAFDRAAADYVLKPVEAERLARTCARLRALITRRRAGSEVHDAVERLGRLLGAPGLARAPAARLRILQASAGNAVTMVPVSDVLYFEAADKYVRVVTAEREHLIRCCRSSTPSASGRSTAARWCRATPSRG